MADRIQQRRDTAARWAQYNPVLLEGEVGYVTDNPNQYKIGDGIHAWNDLPLRGYTGTIVQTTGNDENAVMSQKATTDKLTELEANVGIDEYSVFSDSKDYKAGDTVNYEGRLHTFTADHAKGVWIGTDAEETSVKKEVEKLVKDKTNLFSINGYINRTTGYVSTDSDLYLCTDFCPLSRSTDLVITATNEFNAAICMFYDKNKRKISDYVTSNDGLLKITISASEFPEEAVYFRSSTRKDNLHKSFVNQVNIGNVLSMISEGQNSNLDMLKGISGIGEQFVIQGAYISKVDGNVYFDSNYYITNFTKLDKNNNIIITGYNVGNIALIAFYDKYKNFISYINPEKTGHSTNFIIDKSDFPEKAVYYRATAQKDRIDKSFVINASLLTFLKNDVGRYEYDLRTDNSNEDLIVDGSYASDTAIYTIDADFKGRVSVKGKLLVDVNERSEDVPFIVMKNNNDEIFSLCIHHAIPIQGESSQSGDDVSYVPCARTRSGFSVEDDILYYDRFQRDWSHRNGARNNLLGNKMMIIWWKGTDIINKASSIESVSNNPPSEQNYFSEEELQTRSSNLSLDSGVYIDISKDTFTIGKDDSVMFQTSLKKSDGGWKNIIDFYKELINYDTDKPIDELSDFYIKFIDINQDQTTECIFQCGKIYLVGRYLQLLKHNFNDEYVGDYQMSYDSFPYFVYNKYDTAEHVFDIVMHSQFVDIYSDGDLIARKTINVTSKKGYVIQLGCEMGEIQLYDMEVYKGEYGNIEFKSGRNYLISDRTPCVVGLIGHNIYDTYPGSKVELINVGMSLGNLYRRINQFEKDGYVFINAKQFRDWKLGREKLPHRKCMCIVLDDNQVLTWFDSYRIRRGFEEYGGKLTFAQILRHLDRDDYKVPSVFDIQRVKDSGCDVIVHTRWHSNPIWSKPSAQLWIEMAETEFFINKFGITKSFAFNKDGGEFIPQQDILDYFGYCATFGLSKSTQRFTRLSTCNFNTCRLDCSDNSDLAGL